MPRAGDVLGAMGGSGGAARPAITVVAIAADLASCVDWDGMAKVRDLCDSTHTDSQQTQQSQQTPAAVSLAILLQHRAFEAGAKETKAALAVCRQTLRLALRGRSCHLLIGAQIIDAAPLSVASRPLGGLACQRYSARAVAAHRAREWAHAMLPGASVHVVASLDAPPCASGALPPAPAAERTVLGGLRLASAEVQLRQETPLCIRGVAVSAESELRARPGADCIRVCSSPGSSARAARAPSVAVLAAARLAVKRVCGGAAT
jgi:hypothetical protein